MIFDYTSIMQRIAYYFFFALLTVLSVPLSARDKTVFFGGYEWVIKESQAPVGPGPNLFSARSIAQTGEGVTLGISKRSVFGKERLYGSEMYSREFFGYGSFELDFRRSGRFDSAVVFGFFLYNNDNNPFFSEVDFELARWAIPEAHEGQFTVQPYELSGNFITFPVPDGAGEYTVLIDWKRDRIDFALVERDGTTVFEWSYLGGSLPLMAEGDDVARVHLNFWQFKGMAPAGDGELSVEVTGFRYRPGD